MGSSPAAHGFGRVGQLAGEQLDAVGRQVERFGVAFGGDDYRQLVVGGGRNVEIGLERGGGRFAAGFVAQRDRLRRLGGVEGARLVVA